MAKVKIAAGAEVDILSAEEHERQSSRIIDALNELAKTRSTTTIHRHGAITDASGNIGGGYSGAGEVLYRVTTSFAAALHRLSVFIPGYTPASPLQTGSMMIFADSTDGSNLIYPIPGTSNQTVAPLVFTEGRNNAPLIRRGQSLIVVGAGLPDSVPISFGLQLRVIETAEDVG